MNLLGGRAATTQMFSAASLFSTYASLTALLTLIQQFYRQFVPKPVRVYISVKLENWFTKSTSSSSLFTLVIEQFEEADYDLYNQVYKACETYLANKLKSTSRRLKVSSPNKKNHISFKLAQGEKYSEHFEGVHLQWSFIVNNTTDSSNSEDSKNITSRGVRNSKYFELSFDPDQKDTVFDSYLPFILEFYDDIMERKKELMLYRNEADLSGGWKPVKFKHPFTFDALALDPESKKVVLDDLDRFTKRKEFYKKVGRAWKRGYLLYGPPGTGKSSLIAAMANYLKFDIYDLQLSGVASDSVLRRLLLSTTSKSILVIEDIDCSLGLAPRHDKEEKEAGGNDINQGSHISLSGLLNFIDGLWSSCGDERIIIFTTNYKNRIDPALLRPGRMDMQIHMSYLTMSAFKILASNYLNVPADHPLFGQIEELIQATNVTPAEVAEELIRCDDADVALSRVIVMLNGKKTEQNQEESKKGRNGLMNGNDGNAEGIYPKKEAQSDVEDVVSNELCT